MKKNLLAINIIGEPGSGKTTTAAGVLHHLSMKGKSAEIVSEVAKDFVWEANQDPLDENKILAPEIFKDQLFLFGEQNRRLARLRGKREFAILDCPLVMSILYQSPNYYKNFTPLIVEVIKSYNNLNIFLRRKHDYQQLGRVQTEKETLELRDVLLGILKEHDLPYIEMETHSKIHEEIGDLAIKHSYLLKT